MKEYRKKHSKKSSRRLRAMLFWLNIMALIFIAWTVNSEPDAHRAPPYEKEDITAVLAKERLDPEDYRLLYRQTGLAAVTVEKLLAQGREAELTQLQELFFQEIEVRCKPNTVISREEFASDSQGNPVRAMRIADVEDGDILITFCSHAFGWRNGHAALVVDAEKRLTLEALVMGSPSKILSLDRWERYPSFVVLRLSGVDPEVRGEIARYAMETLADVPYRLGAGVAAAIRYWPEGSCAPAQSGAKPPFGTQCAHLVWYAFAHFGYNLDSDGGLIVTPADLADSPLLDTVQIYGMNGVPDEY